MADTIQQGNAVVLDHPESPPAANKRGHDHHPAAPLAGNPDLPFWTPGVVVLAILAVSGLAVLAARLILGLEAVTNLDDQYPWGIWIGVDVASGVALAAGGFTMAFIAHVLNIERYHVLVRPALLTAAIGYTFVGLGVAIDLGRYYNIWHMLVPSMWQGNSVLFEVGMCVLIYLSVLYIEFLPIVCERFIGRVNLPGVLGKLNGFVESVLRFLDRTLSKMMSAFIIAGVVLSCAHQSSLGSLMAIAPSKLYALWHTPVLPLLFLLSAFAVGFSMAIFESLLASRSFKRKPEMFVLSPLARMIPLLLAIYFAAKVIDLINRDAWPLLFEANTRAVMFWIEILVGVLIPAFLFLSHRLRRHPNWLFASAAMVVFGVMLNRFNVFVTGYTPPYATERYFPMWTEVLLTVGMISLIVFLYRIWVFIFPVLPVEEEVEMRKPIFLVTLFLALILLAVPGFALEPQGDSANPHAAEAKSQSSKLTACASCHRCDHPTPDDPCLIDCPRHGAHFYGEHEADEGPEIVIIDQLANLYRPVVFAHRLHADMSNMTGGCENCHHYSEQSGVIPPCRECHDETKGPVSLKKPALKGAYHRQCINCHLDWSHENACGFCHEQVEGTAIAALDTTDIIGIPHPLIEATPSYIYETTYEDGPVVSFHHTDHVEMFGLNCVDCHRGDSCSRCHHGAGEQLQSSSMDHVSSCFSCHGERDCEFCHNHQAKPNFEHTHTAGWALDPYHEGVSCEICHGQPQNFRTPSDKCASCHIHWEEGGFQHGVTGLELSEDHEDLDCRDCHLEMDFSRQPSCEDCHDDPMLPDNLPGERVKRS